ncbi:MULTISPECIES: sigma-54 dependent transcriptional regulator [unclassified Pseudodesulfovibrio]|uniref:sigma-54-dependent transcriptional regulator n=1 Tax=unclassified Pseudodesulfovibrio TaxID=2661612 RepID=UPI000FEB8EB8|nr:MULTISPECIES: sigma-54 dependent transcriptional regulator [unclassified Pseudodesulfovibrio]MCJ2164564.1 sigma 54-interacting transcriptional regulator [Pseudodesulfovibrio sp. S3-i]RWU04762.1 AAA family ATPase [Pseudodesulfovibrio sp. S3]
MRKMLVITREGSRSQEIGDLLDQDTEILTETASDATRSGDRDVDTLFVDVESLLGRDTTITKALNGLWARFPSAAIVVMADEEQTRYAVDAVKAGAFDYLTHPIEKAELGLIVDKVRESDVLQSELDYLRGQFWSEDFLDYVDTRSKNMRDVFVKTRQVAGTRSTVLLTGETGTGKSLIAKLIHAHSNRKNMPFISVHCGAIPDTLVESELFGHEKGAFTGAVRRKLGKFELAHGGTIFLDEIGTVSQSVQVKLLNVIQERMLQRVGGENDTPVDVRIIAATNEDMGELCEKGKFRRDLFYRLNVFPIRIPPLRDRREDIPRLSEYFIQQFNGLLNTEVKGIHPQVLDTLMEYEWPGNVRELENVIERACILETGDILLPESFPPDLLDTQGEVVTWPVKTSLPLKEARQITIDKFEKQYLSSLLDQCGGVIKDAALRAGVTTRQLNKLMTRHTLNKKDFKKTGITGS